MTDSDWNIPTITKIFTSNSDTLAGIADDAGLNKSKILRFITREEINFEDPTLNQFKLKEENIDYSINTELLAIRITLNKNIKHTTKSEKGFNTLSFTTNKNITEINAIENGNEEVYFAETKNIKGINVPKGTATVSIATFNSTIEIEKEKEISIYSTEPSTDEVHQTNSELFRIVDKEILNLKKEFRKDKKNEPYNIEKMLEKYISKNPKEKENKPTIFISRDTYGTEIITLSKIRITYRKKRIIKPKIPEFLTENIKDALKKHLFNE